MIAISGHNNEKKNNYEIKNAAGVSQSSFSMFISLMFLFEILRFYNFDFGHAQVAGWLAGWLAGCWFAVAWLAPLVVGINFD